MTEFLNERQLKLLDFVKQCHGAQLRKYTNEPYWTHPLEVARIVSDYVVDDGAIEAALCHDLLEDTEITLLELLAELTVIGYSMRKALFIINRVMELTDQFTKEKLPGLNRAARKSIEAVRLGKAHPLAQSIKYADLIDNTSSIVNHDPGFASVYLKEKRELLKQMQDGEASLRTRCCQTLEEAERKLQASAK